MKRGGLLPRQLPLTLVRLGRRAPWTVLGIAAAAWVVATALAFHVRVDTDLLSLVPRDNPVVDNFKTTIDRFGTVDTLLVVVELRPDVGMEAQLAFADRFAASLRASDLIDWVEYRLEDPTETAVPLLDRATLFLDPEELDDLMARLEQRSLVDEALQIRSELTAPQSVVTKELLRLDPMGLLPRILGRVRFGGMGVRVDPETGCLMSADRDLLLMLAKPIGPAQDLVFDRRLADALDQLEAEADAGWEEAGLEPPAPEIGFTGGHIIALDDSELITSDVVVGLVSSLVGVMALFLLAFRRRAALLYAFLPLVTGLALTFAFTAVALGRLNSLTSAFGGLLIGLGIDFIIVLYGRYVEERHAGATHESAVDAMGRFTGVSVLLGAVTTAITFYAFLVTEFRGLWELGLITGTGILLLVTTVYLMLPALLTLLRKRHAGGRRLHLHSFGSDLLCRASLRRPTVTLVLAALVTIALGAAMTGLKFDDDMRNLRSGDNRADNLRTRVMGAFGLRFSPMTIRVDAASESEALAVAREMLPELERLVDEGVLASIDAIAGIVPSPLDQQVVIDRLAAEREQIGDVRARLERALREAGLNPRAFAEGLDHLQAALSVSHPLSLEDLEGTTLARVVDRYLVRWPGGVSAAIYCYLPPGTWREGAPPELERVVERYPGVVISGTNVVSRELRRIVWGDAAKAAILGLVLVYLMIWADLGGAGRAALALLPLVVGMVWMLGAMALLGIRVNFMNIFVVTMIIGIGVDYGLHLLHRWSESGGDASLVAETAKAIAVAALTTMVGFGSLVLSHYPGLRSVGAAAILGALSTAVLAITVLPVLLAWRNGRRVGQDDVAGRGWAREEG